MIVIDFWDEMSALERRMDDVVRSFLGTRTRLAYPALPLFVRKPFVPAMDVFRRDDDLVIRLELPGIDPEKDIRVRVGDHELVIEGERKQEEELKEDSYYRMEATYGAFERHVPVPEGIDEAKVAASYADGVLEVLVPKGAKELPAEARTVPVRTAKPAKAA